MTSSSMNGPRPPVTEPQDRSKRWQRHLIETALGGLMGAAAGFGLMHFVMTTGIESWSVAELLSLLLAMILLLVGGFCVVMTGTVERYRKLVAFRQPGSELPDAEAVTAMRRQSIVIAMTGPLLAAPPMLSHLGLAESGRIVGAAAILLVLGLQSWLNWRAYRESDELVRQVAMTAGAWCFWGGQLALFVWATLAKLGLVAEVDSWTMLTLLMAVYLAVSTRIGLRRGLGQL